MSWIAVVTILGMASVTYLTRVLGYMVLRNRHLSPRATYVMQSAPGCVMVSAISPYFVSNPAEVIAIFIAILCSLRLSMLLTLFISIGSLALLQLVFA
ncbi:AzlD domain-containing protein [Citrobacter braakii]|uniref:AzlD family protein n=1 Tax=Citrobacter braakii TaxID=57706 RepID=UPI001908F10A|nr:AzlD domain-containing protein [Citrobacter braakii]MBJ9228382.1 AzlD domain-containing protein [Citrobacter braakii]